MLRESKLRVKSNSQITNCEGKGYVRKEQGKLGKVDTLKLPTATQPNKLCFRGV